MLSSQWRQIDYVNGKKPNDEIAKHTWTINGTVVSKIKDISRSPEVMYTIEQYAFLNFSLNNF